MALQIYEDLVKHLENTELTKKNGLGKIKEVFFAYYDFYNNNEEYFKIIYDIGKVRQESNNPKLKKYFEIYKKFTDELEELIIEGQNDGSVSKELDPELTTQSLIFVLTGIFNQLTITGDNFSNHIGITKDKFSKHVLNLIHTTLK